MTVYILLNVGQIILYFLGGQASEKIKVGSKSFWKFSPTLPESIIITNSNLNVVLSHLSLKPFLECKNGGVHSILQLQILRVSLLKESFAIDIVLAHSSGFPGKICSTGITLEQQGFAGFIPTTDQQGNPEWSHTSRLNKSIHTCNNYQRSIHGDIPEYIPA